jgi:L-ascorbate metabolism protein UlaG (beta-lactamase superfamily)
MGVNSMQLVEFLEKIEWLESTHPYGSACIRINNMNVIYFDPSHLSEKNMETKADLIMISHSHDDHFSVETLEKLVKPTTIIVCPSDCEEELLQDHFDFNIYVIESGDSVKLHNVKISAFPAYSSSAHPDSAGWLGYVIELNKFKIYFSGDSGFIPEMNNLKNVDIAFVTVREPYMMGSKDVINAINAFKPKILIPIHWIEEEKDDIDYILNNAPESTKVIILETK